MRLSTLKYWILLLVLAAVIIFCCPPLEGFVILSGCDRNMHTWVYAQDCTQVCYRCGLVRATSAIHKFKLDYSTPCVLRRICTRCGYTEEEHDSLYAKHQYAVTGSDACTTSYTCSLCGIHSSESNHDWVYAGCNTPMRCSRCYAKQDTTFSHEYGTANCGERQRCIRCGTIGKIQSHCNIDFVFFTVCLDCGNLSTYLVPLPASIYTISVMILTVFAVIWMKRKRRFEDATLFVPVQDYLFMGEHYDRIYSPYLDKFSIE